ncbi:S41 family peptidase [Flavisolibacter tropicus]|uniref:Tail specific protease domain-containing protein n=1 Tax=Flavisolibacter tropicus TaxID=1492898 RepID=A0A172TZ30_9BACT|nr:S41 family peptidase [Flavisolibacter tropicus]ANE52310.1 hypothetical protein SY85_19280 [Flavisolibacter tropicus]
MDSYLKLFYTITLSFITTLALGQSDSSRFKMVNELTREIKRNYLSFDMALRMCDTISSKLMAGKYDSTLNEDEFAFEITKDLRRISSDLHISVTPPFTRMFDESDFKEINLRHLNRRNKRNEKRFKKDAQREKIEYGEIKKLPGNIGYVEVKSFANMPAKKKANKKNIRLATIFKFLKKTHTLIIDLRDNQGGFFNQANKLCSYFSPASNNYFITTERHYRSDSNDIYKELSQTFKYFTDKKVTSQHNRYKNIYILTSHQTFSSAELTAYKIKSYQPNTTLIGEPTAGGGNGYTIGLVTDLFNAVIPNIKVFDETNANYSYEAKGIIPDIITTTDSAFYIAYQMALKDYPKPLHSKVKYLKKTIALSSPYEQHFQKSYSDYVGDYRKIKIVQEGPRLVMYYDNLKKIILVPEVTDFFTTDSPLSVKFARNNNGSIRQIEVTNHGEFTERFRKL